MSKPIAVLISDVHYNLQTIRLADASMRQAITMANDLNVPLIVAGDLHDTKANLRGECVNAMLETFKLCSQKPYVLVGNHDRINEKAAAHSLNFLKEIAAVIDEPVNLPGVGMLFPYFSDADELRKELRREPKDSLIIMHQGLKDSHMGDYIQDHSAIAHEDVKHFRVISGHYHYRQDIKTGVPRNGTVGLFSYIGNPYTLSWGEANDPEKGFQVLHDDGHLEFVPTNIRKHVIWNVDASLQFNSIDHTNLHTDDLLWVKVADTKERLSNVTRGLVAKVLQRDVFKLTLHPLEMTQQNNVNTASLSQGGLLDALIDGLSNTSIEAKDRVKKLWRDM